MTWLTLALLAAFTWAIGNVFSKKGFENVSPLWNNIIFNIFGLFLWIPFALITSNFHITPLSFPVFLTILLAYITYYIYFYALAKGELSLTGTVLATYPVTTVILSALFLGEKISTFQIIGIVVVIVGSILITLPEKGLPKIVRNYSWLRWGLITAVLIGTGDFLNKYSVNQLGASSQLFYVPLISIILSIGNYLWDKKNRRLPKFTKQTLTPSLIGIFLLSLGNIFFFLAFGLGDASLVAPISSIFPALMVVLAIIFLKEKVTLKQAIGIVLTIIGVILVGFPA